MSVIYKSDPTHNMIITRLDEEVVDEKIIKERLLNGGHLIGSPRDRKIKGYDVDEFVFNNNEDLKYVRVIYFKNNGVLAAQKSSAKSKIIFEDMMNNIENNISKIIEQ